MSATLRLSGTVYMYYVPMVIILMCIPPTYILIFYVELWQPCSIFLFTELIMGTHTEIIATIHCMGIILKMGTCTICIDYVTHVNECEFNHAIF